MRIHIEVFENVRRQRRRQNPEDDDTIVFRQIENDFGHIRRRPLPKNFTQTREIARLNQAANFRDVEFCRPSASLDSRRPIALDSRERNAYRRNLQCVAAFAAANLYTSHRPGVRYGDRSVSLGIPPKAAKINSMSVTATASMIQREVDHGICLLTFDRPESGANIFDAATCMISIEQLDFIEEEDSLEGVVILSAKKSIFIAGADLKTLLHQAQTGEMRAFIAEGQRIFNRLAALKIPTCAAIHGACAGAATKLRWRVTGEWRAMIRPRGLVCPKRRWVDSGLGRCTRLPRLIGAEKAAEVILKGKLYSAQEAKQLGLVDEVVSRDQLLDAAQEENCAKVKGPHPSLSQRGEADGGAAGEGKNMRAPRPAAISRRHARSKSSRKR